MARRTRSGAARATRRKSDLAGFRRYGTALFHSASFLPRNDRWRDVGSRAAADGNVRRVVSILLSRGFRRRTYHHPHFWLRVRTGVATGGKMRRSISAYEHSARRARGRGSRQGLFAARRFAPFWCIGRAIARRFGERSLSKFDGVRSRPRAGLL